MVYLHEHGSVRLHSSQVMRPGIALCRLPSYTPGVAATADASASVGPSLVLAYGASGNGNVIKALMDSLIDERHI